jgi:hypothetical protein
MPRHASLQHDRLDCARGSQAWGLSCHEYDAIEKHGQHPLRKTARAHTRALSVEKWKGKRRCSIRFAVLFCTTRHVPIAIAGDDAWTCIRGIGDRGMNDNGNGNGNGGTERLGGLSLELGKWKHRMAAFTWIRRIDSFVLFFLMCVSVFSTDSVLRLFLKIYMYLQGDDDGEDEVRVDHHRSSDFACLFFSVRLAGWLSDPLLLSFARGRFVA